MIKLMIIVIFTIIVNVMMIIVITSKMINVMIIVVIITSKDARLPIQLQRAMAAEAEAAREARAKVVTMMRMIMMFTKMSKMVIGMSRD